MTMPRFPRQHITPIRRWLLLSFKREFDFSDALRLFEILCSHHLELSSIEAAKARESEIRKERERHSADAVNGIHIEGAGTHMVSVFRYPPHSPQISSLFPRSVLHFRETPSLGCVSSLPTLYVRCRVCSRGAQAC